MIRQLFLLLCRFRCFLLGAPLRHGLGVLCSRGDTRERGSDSEVMCTYVSLIPLAEGRSIDLDDSVLDKGVRPDKLVVRGIVNLR